MTLKDLPAFTATHSEKNTICDKPGAMLGPGDVTINRPDTGPDLSEHVQGKGTVDESPFLHTFTSNGFYRSSNFLLIDITYHFIY